jgi:hypothetical protein
MARGKKHTPEQIVSLLRQIEVAVANGKTTPVACRESGITEQTWYRCSQAQAINRSGTCENFRRSEKKVG